MNVNLHYGTDTHFHLSVNKWYYESIFCT